jgi:hypothetical protein
VHDGVRALRILCLCQEDNHRKLIPGYAAAFRARGIPFDCVDWAPPFDSPLEKIVLHTTDKPSWIFHFESVFPLLPEGLVRSEIPTVCFQVDTYTYTERRMRWSSLFDHVAVFHPGYEKRFRQGGHPGAFLLPHAVRRELFEQLELPREFEVGWVGTAHGEFYQKRQEWIPKLANLFRMNDWKRTYSLEGVAEVYRRSRVVVNIGRDDFPQDANMRAFEVLASGALLVTSLPSELTDLGFEEGVHFAGFRQYEDLLTLVKRFLGDEPARSRIANAGREKVLREHTYDRRVDQILLRLQQFGPQKLAPARQWPASRVELMYLDFFAAHGVLKSAAKNLRHLAGGGFRETAEGAALLGKAWISGRRYDSTQ